MQLHGGNIFGWKEVAQHLMHLPWGSLPGCFVLGKFLKISEKELTSLYECSKHNFIAESPLHACCSSSSWLQSPSRSPKVAWRCFFFPHYVFAVWCEHYADSIIKVCQHVPTNFTLLQRTTKDETRPMFTVIRSLICSKAKDHTCTWTHIWGANY